MDLRPCYLSHVVIDETADQQVVFISEREGSRRFPITIGVFEATAIDRAVKAQRFPRPLTHDLVLATAEALGGRLVEVRIVDLREQTFYARLVFATADGAAAEVDCRPSDALAVLVRAGADLPLLVADHVLSEAAG